MFHHLINIFWINHEAVYLLDGAKFKEAFADLNQAVPAANSATTTPSAVETPTATLNFNSPIRAHNFIGHVGHQHVHNHPVVSEEQIKVITATMLRNAAVATRNGAATRQEVEETDFDNLISLLGSDETNLDEKGCDKNNNLLGPGEKDVSVLVEEGFLGENDNLLGSNKKDPSVLVGADCSHSPKKSNLLNEELLESPTNLLNEELLEPPTSIRQSKQFFSNGANENENPIGKTEQEDLGHFEFNTEHEKDAVLNLEEDFDFNTDPKDPFHTRSVIATALADAKKLYIHGCQVHPPPSLQVVPRACSANQPAIRKDVTRGTIGMLA